VTLLEALRNHANLTGAKEVCDRGTCGACSVLIGDTPIYACSKLAIEMQGQPITTIEGLGKDGKLTPVQQAFVDQDALMCGFCTPGFVISVTALSGRIPARRPARSGVLYLEPLPLRRYPRVLEAALKAAGFPPPQKRRLHALA
jgi:aerobic-type carbon monoxide dehydrogenase small subunit (CoxS/CutS family)